MCDSIGLRGGGRMTQTIDWIDEWVDEWRDRTIDWRCFDAPADCCRWSIHYCCCCYRSETLLVLLLLLIWNYDKSIVHQLLEVWADTDCQSIDWWTIRIIVVDLDRGNPSIADADAVATAADRSTIVVVVAAAAIDLEFGTWKLWRIDQLIIPLLISRRCCC